MKRESKINRSHPSVVYQNGKRKRERGSFEEGEKDEEKEEEEGEVR